MFAAGDSEMALSIQSISKVFALALVVTDRLLSISADPFTAVRDLLRQESGNDSLQVDAVVADSEARHGNRNKSLAHFLASCGNLDNPVEDVLQAYINQCSVAMSCSDLALASRFLASNGIRGDGTALLSPPQTKRINAVMLTCGTYDAAGEFAYRVGLPGKSGVGGGIIAVVPNNCGDAGNGVPGSAQLRAWFHRW